MVNDRFLLAALYDFERVDAPPAPLRITGNRNPAGSEGGDFFWRKRLKLRSPQSLGIYRGQLKGRADCEPGSQASTTSGREASRRGRDNVFSAAHGILARARARAAAAGQDARIGEAAADQRIRRGDCGERCRV